MLADTRIRSLYSDFRELKLVNPEGFEANLREWRHYLLKDVWQGKIIINSESLLEELSTKEHGIPKSIDIVIDELVKEGLLVPIQKYIQKENDGLIMSLLKWSIHKTIIDLSWKSRRSESANYLEPCKYVNLSWFSAHNKLLFDTLKDNIYRKANKYVDYVYTKRDFYRASKIDSIVHDWESFEVVLEYLHRKKELIINEEGIVKLIGASSTLPTAECNKITKEDSYTANINEVFHKVEHQVSIGEDLIALTKKKLRESISKSDSKRVQKVLLRLQKQREKDLEQAYDSLEKIRKIRYTISTATDNVTMFSLLNQTNNALKAINSKLIDKDSINSILDEFNENSQKHSEISGLLTYGEDIFDNEDLEKELENLEKESMEKNSVHEDADETNISPQKDQETAKTNSTELLETLFNLTVKDTNQPMALETLEKNSEEKSSSEKLLV